MIIYETINTVNGKKYIGQDSNNDPTYYGSGKLLQYALKKYGIEKFQKRVIEYCNSLEELNEREKYWINKLGAVDDPNYYNIIEGGTGGYNEFAVQANRSKRLGKTWEEIYSSDGLQKMQGIESDPTPLIDYVKENGPWNRGKKNVQSGYWRGKKRPDISKKLKGRIVSKEHKEMISNTVSNIWLDKTSVYNTLEYRKKLSEARTRRWEREKITEEQFMEACVYNKTVTDRCHALQVSIPTYYKYKRMYS